MSKKFDISNLTFVSLDDVRKVNLPSDSTFISNAAHSSLIIRKSGSATYEYKGKHYTSNADTVLFIAKGSEYKLTVEESGETTVIEFDITPSQQAELFSDGAVCEYMTLGDKSILKIAKNLKQF